MGVKRFRIINGKKVELVKKSTGGKSFKFVPKPKKK